MQIALLRVAEERVVVEGEAVCSGVCRLRGVCEVDVEIAVVGCEEREGVGGICHGSVGDFVCGVELTGLQKHGCRF